jgi:hypothetical protein
MDIFVGGDDEGEVVSCRARHRVRSRGNSRVATPCGGLKTAPLSPLSDRRRPTRRKCMWPDCASSTATDTPGRRCGRSSIPVPAAQRGRGEPRFEGLARSGFSDRSGTQPGLTEVAGRVDLVDGASRIKDHYRKAASSPRVGRNKGEWQGGRAHRWNNVADEVGAVVGAGLENHACRLASTGSWNCLVDHCNYPVPSTPPVTTLLIMRVHHRFDEYVTAG